MAQCVAAFADDDDILSISSSHSEGFDHSAFSLEQLSAPERETEGGDEVDVVFLDLEESRAVESQLADLHLHEVDVGGDILVQRHRGCRDRDFPSECRMTPVLDISSRGREFWVNVNVQALQDSPIKRLELHPEAVEWAAACSYRMETFSKRKSQVDSYATCFAVSPSTVVTAEHCAPVVEDRYRITDILPSTEEVFQNAKCKKISLKKTIGDGVIGLAMVDPVNGEPISAFGQLMDVTALRIENKGSQHQKFEEFLLPMSLSHAVEQYGRTGALSIGVVGFPMCTEFVKGLRSPFNEDRERIFDNYKASMKDWWSGLLKGMGLQGSLKEDKAKLQAAKQRLLNKIIDMLEGTFMGFNKGQLLCSVGRLLSYNETTIAATYSWLHGGSGAALVSPDVQFAGVFFGIHMGPAEFQLTANGGKIYPDHNIATSCDNPAYVKYYFKNVLPTLPGPSCLDVEGGRHRLTAFCSWLVLHLPLILSSKPDITSADEWSTEQKSWLSYVLEHLGSKRTLFVGSFTEDDEDAVRVGRKLVSLGPMLLELGLASAQKNFFVAPQSLEELQALLEDPMGVKMFVNYISDTMKRQGVCIEAWGFYAGCTVFEPYVLWRLASMLAM